MLGRFGPGVFVFSITIAMMFPVAIFAIAVERWQTNIVRCQCSLGFLSCFNHANYNVCDIIFLRCYINSRWSIQAKQPASPFNALQSDLQKLRIASLPFPLRGLFHAVFCSLLAVLCCILLAFGPPLPRFNFDLVDLRK